MLECFNEFLCQILIKSNAILVEILHKDCEVHQFVTYAKNEDISTQNPDNDIADDDDYNDYEIDNDNNDQLHNELGPTIVWQMIKITHGLRRVSKR